jgi:protein O-mannosyl-transferase
MAAVLLVYGPALRGGFVWDDDAHISANPTLRSLKGLWDIWFQPGVTCQYYPLTFTVFWAGYHLWGLNTLGYHLLTVLLHGVVAVLLWQVLKRFEVRAAWLAGAIFALHPVNVMSVAWMTELKNTLSGALALGAAWAYLRFAGLGVYARITAQPGTNVRCAVASLALFLLAMFAKTAVSFLPATLLLVVWWKRGRVGVRPAWPLLAMFVVVAGMGLLTLHIERLHGAAGDAFQMGLRERILVSGRSFWFYLGKLFFPYPLTFIYERWNINPGSWWQYAYPTAMLLLLGGTWYLRRRIGKGLFVALLHFYLATSMLVLVQVLYMMRYSFVTDHWQYFGCMSVFAAVAVGLAGALTRWNWWFKPAGILVIGGLLLALAGLSWRQCAMYADAETFWLTNLRRNPDCSMAYYNLGLTYFQQGRLDEAIRQYQKVLQSDPNEIDALNNLGSALLQQGRTDEAIASYQKVLARAPDSAAAHNALALAYVQQGRMDEAVAHLQKALASRPDYVEAHYNLGNTFLQQGRTGEAIAEFQKALASRPDYAEAHNNLGNAFVRAGQMDNAIVQYQEALAIKPDYGDAQINLGNALLQQGRLDEAIAHYQKALARNPDDPEIHDHLANALLQRGRAEEAIVHYRKALAIKPDTADIQNKLAWLLATSPQASLRDGNQAVELAQKANQLTGGENPVVLCTLAAAYAEAGRFVEAVATAQHALQLAGAQSNTELADELQSQLKLYQAHLPFHMPEPATPAPPSP